MTTLATQKHYRVQELAALWGLSVGTISTLFRHEPGVLKIGRDAGKRQYVTLSIPESVAALVHERLGHNPLKASAPRRNPLRVVHLRDLHGRVTKQARNVIKRDTPQQRADGERVA